MPDVRIWNPGSSLTAALEDRIARVFHEVFTSPPHWDKNPIPLGETHKEEGSVRYLLRSFLDCGLQVVLASANDKEREPAESPILGFSIGGQIDKSLHKSFGLAPYGAEIGDGVLPFAGLVPLAQGYRLSKDRNIIRHEDGLPNTCRSAGGTSLYRALFEARFTMTPIESCSTIWLRTRQVLTSVQHVAKKNGFEYQDTFFVDFRGETQDRMVFKKVR